MTAQPTDALAVDCPKCSAKARWSCLTSTGKKTAPHTDRIKAAEAAAAKPTKKRTKRTCTVCGVGLSSRNNDRRNNSDLCNRCFEQAGLENEHQDGHHDDAPNDACPMCNPDAADKPNTAPKSWSSHADCDHPSTKSARAACRRERAKAAAAA